MGVKGLTLSLLRMTKTEFLLTISRQYQADKWWEQKNISIVGLLADAIPNGDQVGHS